MCKNPLHGLLQLLPKTEHHMHLEGALRPDVLFKLAARNDIVLPQDDPSFGSPEALLSRYDRFSNLDDFLAYYYIGISVLVEAPDFETLAWDYFLHAASDGVLHAEVFFDPQAHLSRGVSYDVVLSGFSAARKRAETELGISSELICCFLRHLPVVDCLSTFLREDVQASFQNGEVIGIGLDSSEKEFPPERFEEIYSKAKAVGLRRTAHAGEEGPAEYIDKALGVLGVERIDHGIKLADDADLLSAVARSGTLLTICPLSNVLLKCVSSIADLPLRQFLDDKVEFSINSDDPAYFGGYILDNYCAVQEAFALSISEWKQICVSGINGSWCSQERKEVMHAKLEEVTNSWSRRD